MTDLGVARVEIQSLHSDKSTRPLGFLDPFIHSSRESKEASFFPGSFAVYRTEPEDAGEEVKRTLLVKIFMRRDCSIGVGRQDVLDSGCHVAHRAQAEQLWGRAKRCSCLGGCVLGDNALGTG